MDSLSSLSESVESHSLSVLDMQRTCVHDGPGIRTVIFFRGCTLRCAWCHNPEAQSFGSCNSGTPMTVADLMNAVKKDREYYRTTHGGVTLSGGDPLLQRRETLLQLLKDLKSEQIHVAVETAGDVPWETIEATIPYVDLYLFDLKTVGDDELHRRLTGRSLHTIEKNARQLAATGARVLFRMCVVPGLNDSRENIEATANLLKSVGHRTIGLLRYYNLHESKARKLGISQKPLNIDGPRSIDAFDRAAKAFGALGMEIDDASPDNRRRRAKFSRRVLDLQKEVQSGGYSVCLESAVLRTRFYKEHGFQEPVKVQRAKLLRYLLNNKQVKAYPNELIVGNYTSKRVGGNIWVEYFGACMAGILWNINRQKPVPFRFSFAEKLRFYFTVLPFWARHGLTTKVFPSWRQLGGFIARMFEKKVGFNNNLAAIAHYIVNSERFLRLGTSGIADEIKAKRERSEKAADDFYESVLIALAGVEEFAARYADHLDGLERDESDDARKAELKRMAEVCRHVPKYPARTFHEALQAILFMHIALCTESFENAISFGRMDKILYPYYQADLAAGRIDYDRALELLACFVLKVEEVVLVNDGDSGLQLGKLFESLSTDESLTVGGVDEDGKDSTNDVTYMILDTCELRPIGINMTARIHRGSPDEYVKRIAEVYLNGSPMPALYNDEIYLKALQGHYDITAAQARNYAIVGCVEPNASDDHFGNTDCANVNITMPFLQALKGDQSPLWKNGIFGVYSRKLASIARLEWLRGPSYRLPETMDELMERFEARTNEVVAAVLADHVMIEKALSRRLPTPLASSLSRGCVACGKDVYEGGAEINTSGIQAVGATDVADSLFAIDELVFRRKLFTLAEIVRAIDADFRGERNQVIRKALLEVPKFGKDSARGAAEWLNRVLKVYVKALTGTPHGTRNGRYVAGYYGLNVNRIYGTRTPALPSGRLKGAPLANSICPHYGMQMVDLTSSLNAVAQIDFPEIAPNGTTLTSTVDAGLFPGQRGTANLAGLIRGYFDQGGMQFQPNLISREMLLEAYRNPDKYPNLVVRIAGFCARFNDLSEELKLEIIDRTYYSDAMRG